MNQEKDYMSKIDRYAEMIKNDLNPIIEKMNGKVHFRPSASGITMVSLSLDRPQLGKGGYKKTSYLVQYFDSLYKKHCSEHRKLGRKTPEKRLQSFLISEAYLNGRKLISLTTDISDLLFITDEIALPLNSKIPLSSTGNKVVCDILALRRHKNECIPVLIELKSKREKNRLIEQLNNYEKIFKRNSTYFERLFSTLLDKDVKFSEGIEKWLVWPALKSNPNLDPDTQESKLNEAGIGVIQYTENKGVYRFAVGNNPVVCD